MTGSLAVLNGSEWDHALTHAYADLGLQSEEQVAELAGMISKNMREGAPVMDAGERARRQQTESGRKHTRRRPGKVTIKFIRGHDARGFYIDVGPGKGAFYLAFHEYGTVKQKARPFLRPAIEKAIAAWSSAGSH